MVDHIVDVSCVVRIGGRFIIRTKQSGVFMVPYIIYN